MKKIFLTMAAAALVMGFTACSSEDTTTTTTDVDTNMNTAAPAIMTPSDNTGDGIEGGDMNTSDAVGNNTGSGSSSSTTTGGSNSSGIMGPGTNVTNTGSGTSSTANRNAGSSGSANNDGRYQAGPDAKSPSAPNSQRGGNEVIKQANETNDRSDRVKTPQDVNPRTGLAPVR